MASKQLGKLRQWAGEVISSRDKTTLSEEFQELEKDVELRREGAAKLLAASEVYQRALSKKKKNEAFEDASSTEKLLPIDMLGIVMIVHGEQFGDDSAFGTSLVKLGRAHCKVATLQEAYALTLNDTFLASLGKFMDDVREYDAQRKKLDSRRLSYDAAVAKFEKLKNSKKEKEKREAEEEMEKARQRYEETSDDVQSQMHDIQEKEIVQLRELTAFLNLEIGFVEQYLNVLKDAKDSWYEESSLVQVPPRRSTAPAHVFPRPGSVQSRASNRSNVRDPSDSDEEPVSRPPSRRLSKRSDSVSSRPPSRPSSRSSRKRADSGATVGEKDDKEKDKISKRLGVAGWASSAVESVTGRSKKNKDKDKFATLDDEEVHERQADEEGKRSPGKKTSSFHSLSRKLSRDKSKEASPKLSGKILKPPSLQERKVVRARHSFSGAADELSFNTGDEIVVINEVLDGWWMGELNGKKGLFPTTHVEAVTPRPALSRLFGGPSNTAASASFLPNGVGHSALDDRDSVSYMSTDLDDDHDLGKQPLSAHHASPFFSGPPDAASISSSLAEEEDDKLFVPFSRNADFDSAFDAGGEQYFRSAPVSRAPSVPPPERKVLHSLNTSPQPPLPRRATTSETKSAPSMTPAKKAPPPPPPRRSTTTAGPTPPIPERPYKYQSSSSTPLNVPTPASSVSGHGYDRSPFESATELSTPDTSDGACTDFKQSPFQTRGMCDNCFQFHG
ncbi:putative BAR domain containing protein [Lyophyllum shimeji]|uniref:BAR domain containing protein n=1 Tax=Lyophyllum shimeji TaxID=47721 RepID=A0A9P3UTF0_LYOSH|nr:putative BAR domain containing protein [Lyophyllum shimeji]